MSRFLFILTLLYMQIPLTVSAQKTVLTMHWQTVGKLPVPTGQTASIGVAGPVTGTHEGFLFVGGGANFPKGLPWEGGTKYYYDDLFLFKPVSNGQPDFTQSFRLPEPLAYAALCQTSRGIFVGGGENSQGIRSSAYLMGWDTRALRPFFLRLPDLPIPLTNAMAAFHNGTILFAGGESAGATYGHCFQLDLQQTDNGWKEVASLPKPVSHGVLTFMDSGSESGFVMAGGRRKNQNGISTIYSECYRLKPGAEKWEAMASMPFGAAAGTGLLLQKDQLLLIGGDKGETFSRVETLLAAIALEKDPLVKEQLIAQKNQLQRNHPGFSRECLLFDLSRNGWSNAGIIPYVTPVTTTALHWNGKILLPSGEIRAGVRTPLFLIGSYKP